jgi:AAA domain-containing protein
MTDILTPANARGSIGGRPITPVSDRTPYLNMLIYGDSGTGKTYLGGSADEVPAMRPLLIVDVEGGTETLRQPFPDIDIVRVESWKQMQQVYDELHRSQGAGYETVMVDSLTEVQKFNMDQIMKELVERRPDLDPDVPSMREWGKNLTQMRKFVRAFRDLPMHTIFTALTRTDKDNNDRTLYLPSLSGKLAGEVAAFLDVVGYYYTKSIVKGNEEELHRVLLTRKTDKHVAKDRTGNLQGFIVDPTMRKIHEQMYPSPAK